MADTSAWPSNARRSRIKRGLLGALSILMAASLFGGGWLAALSFVSPEQKAAQAEPPPPGDVVGPVTLGELVETIGARGQFTPEQTREVTLAAVKAPTVVTKQTLPAGTPVTGGSVLLEVNGRPVFALVGTFSFYRDLSPGLSGPDVAQLQQALTSAGFSTKVDGVFGNSTLKSLRLMYKQAGYSAPEWKPAIEADPANPDVVAQEEEGVAFPLTEAVVITDSNAVLSKVPAVGALLGDEPALELTSGLVVAHIEVATTVASSIPAGTAVALTLDDGTTLDGKVLGSEASMEAPETTILLVGATAASFPSELIGHEVSAVIELNRLADEGLIVPSSAVVPRGDGTAVVLKQLPDGSFEEVRVREIAALAGRSAIELIDGELTVNDTVKVS